MINLTLFNSHTRPRQLRVVARIGRYSQILVSLFPGFEEDNGIAGLPPPPLTIGYYLVGCVNARSVCITSCIVLLHATRSAMAARDGTLHPHPTLFRDSRRPIVMS